MTFRVKINFIKLYLSPLRVLYSLIGPGKGNIIHEYTIFAAPKFGFSENMISLLIKTYSTVRIVLSKTIFKY